MGNWNITINGIGAHDNGSPLDADELAKEFVNHLKKQGQTVTNATFNSGYPWNIDADKPKE